MHTISELVLPPLRSYSGVGSHLARRRRFGRAVLHQLKHKGGDRRLVFADDGRVRPDNVRQERQRLTVTYQNPHDQLSRGFSASNTRAHAGGTARPRAHLDLGCDKVGVRGAIGDGRRHAYKERVGPASGFLRRRLQL